MSSSGSASSNGSSSGGGRSASATETVAGDMHLGDRAPHANAKSGRSSSGSKVQKVCCACGKDVAHEERYKDRNGHYWCMDCGVQEHRSKHKLSHPADTAPCADCAEQFDPAKLVEYETLKLCPGCAEKRAKAAEREQTRLAARKAAMAQEMIDAERRRKRTMLIAGVAVGVAALWVVYVIAF